jgi:hypothetical protein
MRETGPGQAGKRLRRALTPLRETLATSSHLYVLVRNVAFPLLAAAHLVEGEFAFNIEPYRREPSPALNDWYRDTEMLVGETVRAADEAQAALLFLVIPDRFQVYDAVWNQSLGALGYASGEVSFDAPNRRLAGMLQRQAVDYLDLLGPMREAQATEFYFSRDGHWNAAGHAFAATQILAWLASSGFRFCTRAL